MKKTTYEKENTVYQKQLLLHIKLLEGSILNSLRLIEFEKENIKMLKEGVRLAKLNLEK